MWAEKEHLAELKKGECAQREKDVCCDILQVGTFIPSIEFRSVTFHKCCNHFFYAEKSSKLEKTGGQDQIWSEVPKLVLRWLMVDVIRRWNDVDPI